MRIVTEMQINTTEGLKIEVNSLGSQYIVVYNPWSDGKILRGQDEVPLDELRNAVAAGEVHSILVTSVERVDDDDDCEYDFDMEDVETQDILIMASSITSMITNDVTVKC